MTSILSARTALLVELLRGRGTLVDLLKRVATGSQQQVVHTQGSSRPAVKSLVEDGLATEVREEGHCGQGAVPYVYALTASGREVARAQRLGLLALATPSEEA